MKKTSYSHSLRAIPFCLLSAALFSGCASMAPTTVPGQQVFYGTGNTFRMNGLQLTELKAGSLPKDVTALMVKSSADARTLDKMIAYYSGKASEAIAQGDAEQYAVALRDRPQGKNAPRSASLFEKPKGVNHDQRATHHHHRPATGSAGTLA